MVASSVEKDGLLFHDPRDGRPVGSSKFSIGPPAGNLNGRILARATSIPLAWFEAVEEVVEGRAVVAPGIVGRCRYQGVTDAPIQKDVIGHRDGVGCRG